jgi:transposase-like protein
LFAIARRLSYVIDEEVVLRSIGVDVHRDFCEVAIAEAGEVRAAGRVTTEPEALKLFAQSLAPCDEVASEATANALAIARIVEPHVRRVVLANPKAVRETSRRAKTDTQGRKFTPQQKRELVMASWRGERSIAELGREHDISESLLVQVARAGAGGWDGTLRRRRAALSRRRAAAADRRVRAGARQEDV